MIPTLNALDVMEEFRTAVLAALGASPEVIEPGRLHRFATRTRRGDDAGWCKLFEDLRGGVFGDFRTGITGKWSSFERRRLARSERAELARRQAESVLERAAERRAQWQANATRLERLWSECRAIDEDDNPGARYLQKRLHGDPPAWPACLRWHPALPYWVDGIIAGTWPAMVSAVVSPLRQVVALHRTWITADGHKAPTPGPTKKLTGSAGSLTGACIPLGEPVERCLGVAEGIETALAAWCASGVPTVAAYCASMLASWQWPQRLHRLIVFADHDAPGRAAADELRSRAVSAGLRCEVMTPSEPGADWCDTWSARALEAAA